MPWSNNNGGWQGNGQGNGQRPGGQRPGGPWGQPPRGPQRPGGGGGNQPPDLEELLKRSQDKLKGVLPRGTGSGPSFSPLMLGAIAAVALVLYLFSSFYTVEPDEVGVELVFGDPKEEVMGPGGHFAFWPVESVEKVKVDERKISVGSSGGRSNNRQGLMLSGDQNIVNVSFAVLYTVVDPQKFLFAVAEPEQIVTEVAESAMREVVGRRPVQDVFRDNRREVEVEVQQIVRATLESYDTGIEVRGITIEDAAPPAEVSDAFDDVQRAEQDEDRVQEEANRERNRILGGARGEAASIRETAAAYKNRVVEEAKGEAQRFISTYEGYRVAPDATKRRLFLETMEEVLSGRDKVILGSGTAGSNGVVPYLPLPELQRRQSGASTNN